MLLVCVCLSVAFFYYDVFGCSLYICRGLLGLLVVLSVKAFNVNSKMFFVPSGPGPGPARPGLYPLLPLSLGT